MPCYAIRTNHLGIHSRATKHRHRQQQCTTYHRPIADHAQQCFKGLDERIKARPAPIILDSGCGRGLSSQILAQRYPKHWVIALDQSAHRLARLPRGKTPNLLIAHANCIDIWRLFEKSDHVIDLHTVFYPNPWPKSRHEKRRWYAHPVSPIFLRLSSRTIIRSNWLFYLQKTALVAQQNGVHTRLSQLPNLITSGITHFEIKYQQQSIALYELQLQHLGYGSYRDA